MVVSLAEDAARHWRLNDRHWRLMRELNSSGQPHEMMMNTIHNEIHKDEHKSWYASALRLKAVTIS